MRRLVLGQRAYFLLLRALQKKIKEKILIYNNNNNNNNNNKFTHLIKPIQNNFEKENKTSNSNKKDKRNYMLRS